MLTCDHSRHQTDVGVDLADEQSTLDGTATRTMFAEVLRSALISGPIVMTTYALQRKGQLYIVELLLTYHLRPQPPQPF